MCVISLKSSELFGFKSYVLQQYFTQQILHQYMDVLHFQLMFHKIMEVALIAVSASFMNDESSIFRLCNSDFNAESIHFFTVVF
jgi:hypothetical protein